VKIGGLLAKTLTQVLIVMDEVLQNSPPAEVIEQADSTTTTTPIIREQCVIATSFSGPLPPPNALKAYNDILPGAADRIILMAEQQAEHRQRMEKRVIESSLDHERVGMVFAFVLTIGLMIIGSILIVLGKSVAGFLAIFIPVIFQGANYLFIKKTNRSDDKKESGAEKNKNL
jgi:uncharacterized membrane protein